MRHGRTPFGFFDEEEDLDDWITFDPPDDNSEEEEIEDKRDG